jgi:hypothetical protein
VLVRLYTARIGRIEKDRQKRTAFRNDDRHGLHSTTIVCKVFAD